MSQIVCAESELCASGGVDCSCQNITVEVNIFSSDLQMGKTNP